MSGITDWLDQAQARADDATPGPWESGPEGTSEDDFGVFAPEVAHDIVAAEEEADAEFIAAARTDLPAAIAALRAVLDLVEMDREDHIAAMRDYTPVVAKSSVRAAIASALDVTS